MVGIGCVAKLAQELCGREKRAVILHGGGAVGFWGVAVEIERPINKEPLVGAVDELVLRIMTLHVQVALHELEKREELGTNLLEVGLVAGVALVVRELGEPVGRVAGDAVDVLDDGRGTDEAGERVLEQEMIVKDGVADVAAHVGVAHPAAAIALRRVPDVVLHAEVHSVGAGGPDAVQQGIGRLEGALVLDGIVDVFEANGLESRVPEGRKENGYAHKRKADFGPWADACAGTRRTLTPR